MGEILELDKKGYLGEGGVPGKGLCVTKYLKKNQIYIGSVDNFGRSDNGYV